VFGRWGWNEGRHESYAYTEVDQTAQIGAGANGKPWHRKFDAPVWYLFRTAFRVTTQEYLRSAAPVFFLGDGRLNYGRENIVETYSHSTCGGGILSFVGLQQHLTIPATTGTGTVIVPACAYTWSSKCLYRETSWQRRKSANQMLL